MSRKDQIYQLPRRAESTTAYHVADISGRLDLTRMRSSNIMDELVERSDVADHFGENRKDKLAFHLKLGNTDTY